MEASVGEGVGAGVETPLVRRLRPWPGEPRSRAPSRWPQGRLRLSDAFEHGAGPARRGPATWPSDVAQRRGPETWPRDVAETRGRDTWLRDGAKRRGQEHAVLQPPSEREGQISLARGRAGSAGAARRGSTISPGEPSAARLGALVPSRRRQGGKQTLERGDGRLVDAAVDAGGAKVALECLHH